MRIWSLFFKNVLLAAPMSVNQSNALGKKSFFVSPVNHTNWGRACVFFFLFNLSITSGKQKEEKRKTYQITIPKVGKLHSSQRFGSKSAFFIYQGDLARKVKLRSRCHFPKQEHNSGIFESMASICAEVDWYSILERLIRCHLIMNEEWLLLQKMRWKCVASPISELSWYSSLEMLVYLTFPNKMSPRKEFESVHNSVPELSWSFSNEIPTLFLLCIAST